jgi:CSLREA domain-containing protein
VAAVVSASLALVVVPGTAAPQGQFGNVVVDTTKDGNDGECAKDCTLREAIAVADTNAGQFVQLPPGVYKLTLGQLVLGNDIVFGVGFGGNQSAGARTTVIDGRGASSLVTVSSGASAVLAGLTLTGGNAASAGGAAQVPASAQLSLYDTIVRDNTAGVRGGAIDNAGNLALWHTTVVGNSSGSGGGIASEENGNTSIYSSTISGNRATANGGGITSASSLSLQSVTIAANTAAAGGGLYQESTSSASTLMVNTLLGPNTGGSCGGSINGVPRNFTSHNLDADGTCLFASPDEGTSGDPRLAGLANNGGPTDTIALRAGSPAINAGDSQLCPAGSANDQRYATAVGVCDIGAFEFGGKPPEPTVPPPVAGKTVNVSTKSGKVLVKIPGTDEFFDLEDVQQIPVGSTIDTRKGKVTFKAAGKSKAWLYEGLFKFSQKKGKKPLTTLTLTEKLTGCTGSGKASAAAAKKKKRRLWGDGKGKFTTKGKHSAATVVGTKWYVEDRCNGTLTVVKRGVVKVRDFKKRKTVIVKAGHKYFAKR